MSDSHRSSVSQSSWMAANSVGAKILQKMWEGLGCSLRTSSYSSSVAVEFTPGCHCGDVRSFCVDWLAHDRRRYFIFVLQWFAYGVEGNV